MEFDLENTWPEGVIVLKQIEQQGLLHCSLLLATTNQVTVVFFSFIIKSNFGPFHFSLCHIVVENTVVKHREIIVGNSSFY